MLCENDKPSVGSVLFQVCDSVLCVCVCVHTIKTINSDLYEHNHFRRSEKQSQKYDTLTFLSAGTVILEGRFWCLIPATSTFAAILFSITTTNDSNACFLEINRSPSLYLARPLARFPIVIHKSSFICLETWNSDNERIETKANKWENPRSKFIVLFQFFCSSTLWCGLPCMSISYSKSPAINWYFYEITPCFSAWRQIPLAHHFVPYE